MALSELGKLTESEWKKAKTDAGIPSSGIFAKSDQKNNIGPCIAAFQRARTKLAKEETVDTASGYLQSLDKLDQAIGKLIGGEGVKGNRELTSPKAKDLAAGLDTLRKQVVKARDAYNSKLVKSGGLKGLQERENALKRANLNSVDDQMRGIKRK